MLHSHRTAACRCHCHCCWYCSCCCRWWCLVQRLNTWPLTRMNWKSDDESNSDKICTSDTERPEEKHLCLARSRKTLNIDRINSLLMHHSLSLCRALITIDDLSLRVVYSCSHHECSRVNWHNFQPSFETQGTHHSFSRRWWRSRVISITLLLHRNCTHQANHQWLNNWFLFLSEVNVSSWITWGLMKGTFDATAFFFLLFCLSLSLYTSSCPLSSVPRVYDSETHWLLISYLTWTSHFTLASSNEFFLLDR